MGIFIVISIVSIIIFFFIIQLLFKSDQEKEQIKLQDRYIENRDKKILDKVMDQRYEYKGGTFKKIDNNLNKKEYKYVVFFDPKKRGKQFGTFCILLHFNSELSKEELNFFKDSLKRLTTTILMGKIFNQINANIKTYQDQFIDNFKKSFKFEHLDLYFISENYKEGELSKKEYKNSIYIYEESVECLIIYRSKYYADVGYFNILIYKLIDIFSKLPKDQFFENLTNELINYLKKFDFDIFAIKIDGYGEKIYDKSGVDIDNFYQKKDYKKVEIKNSNNILKDQSDYIIINKKVKKEIDLKNIDKIELDEKINELDLNNSEEIFEDSMELEIDNPFD